MEDGLRFLLGLISRHFLPPLLTATKHFLSVIYELL
jgi:hypothetical protein